MSEYTVIPPLIRVDRTLFPHPGTACRWTGVTQEFDVLTLSSDRKFVLVAGRTNTDKITVTERDLLGHKVEGF